MDTVHECDRQTDGQTDGRTDGQTDRITITDTVQRRASHGKNTIGTRWFLLFLCKVGEILVEGMENGERVYSVVIPYVH